MNSPDVFFTTPLASKFHQRETGKGFLRASDGSEVGCRFVLEQTPAGDIDLRCLLDSMQSEAWKQRPRPEGWFNEHESLSFDLATDDGYHLENLQFHEAGSGGFSNNGQQQSYEFSLSQIELKKLTPDKRPVAFAEFSIVNFAILGGNTGVRFSNLWHWPDDVVTLRLGDRECWLRAVKGATEVIKQIKATRGVDVTATFMLPLNSDDEWGETEKLIDNLCTVLTLLTGNRVTWISARAVDAPGYALTSHWRDSVTNSYTTQDMLNSLSTSMTAVQAFTSSYVPIIERMVSRFDVAQQKWNLRSAINTWHETVISDHFLEQRGLLIAACMEMLRTRYLKYGGRETILDARTFEAQKKALSKDLKKSLKENFPVQKDWDEEKKRSHNQDLSLMYGHVRSFNYFPFRRSLEQMANELGMMAFPPENEAYDLQRRLSMRPFDVNRADEEQFKSSIACFVRIRDHLTHQGNFVGLSDDGNATSRREAVRQFQFLERFVGAFLCSTLGWIQPLPTALDLPG